MRAGESHAGFALMEPAFLRFVAEEARHADGENWHSSPEDSHAEWLTRVVAWWSQKSAFWTARVDNPQRGLTS